MQTPTEGYRFLFGFVSPASALSALAGVWPPVASAQTPLGRTCMGLIEVPGYLGTYRSAPLRTRRISNNERPSWAPFPLAPWTPTRNQLTPRPTRPRTQKADDEKRRSAVVHKRIRSPSSDARLRCPRFSFLFPTPSVNHITTTNINNSPHCPEQTVAPIHATAVTTTTTSSTTPPASSPR